MALRSVFWLAVVAAIIGGAAATYFTYSWNFKWAVAGGLIALGSGLLADRVHTRLEEW